MSESSIQEISENKPIEKEVVKLWKIFFIIHILGTIALFIIGFGIQAVFMMFSDARLPSFVMMVPFFIGFPFTLLSLWKATPNPKKSIKEALVKVWVALAVYYYFWVLYNSFTGPL